MNFITSIIFFLNSVPFLFKTWKIFKKSNFQKHWKYTSNSSISFCTWNRTFIYRRSHPEVFLGKGILKIWSKFTGEHPCRSAISIKLQSDFIEIALWHGCSLVNLLHIFRTPLLKNTSGWLLLYILRKALDLDDLLENDIFKTEFKSWNCSKKLQIGKLRTQKYLSFHFFKTPR